MELVVEWGSEIKSKWGRWRGGWTMTGYTVRQDVTLRCRALSGHR
jgi:hypothetical protein